MTTTPSVDAPTPSIDPRVTVTFAARGPSTTCWIEIAYPVGAEPGELLADLAAAGFSPDDLRRVPPAQAYGPNAQGVSGPLGYEEQEISLVSPGSALFGGWTEDERRRKMRRARAALRKHGFTGVPVWRKTLAEML